MKKIKFMMLLSVAIGLGSCSTSTQAVYWVNSSQVESSAGAGKMQCLQVYKGDNLSKAQWEPFCAPIEGFNTSHKGITAVRAVHLHFIDIEF